MGMMERMLRMPWSQLQGERPADANLVETYFRGNATKNWEMLQSYEPARLIVQFPEFTDKWQGLHPEYDMLGVAAAPEPETKTNGATTPRGVSPYVAGTLAASFVLAAWLFFRRFW